MKRHVHFVLLILGTATFLYTMQRYSAPLRLPDQALHHISDPSTNVAYNQINDSYWYSEHILTVLRGSIKLFALYIAFVVVLIAHRLFYGSTRASGVSS